jgi:RNA 2',3'-cyclic 3'-phosphodiesterase
MNAAMNDGIRAFIAIRLAAEVNEAIADFQAGLRKLGGDISWTAPDNFHLTLRFLGNRVTLDVIDKMIDGLRDIAAQTPPFILDARGAGAFPSLNRPRVIWIGLADRRLVELAGRVEALSIARGFEPERRGFTPHLTIGRVRNPSRNPGMRDALSAAAERDFGASRVASMALYRSHLSPHGAKYEALATLPLMGL